MPHPRDRRVSRRIAAISESATLKVDARARALRAEGRPVVGFGVGEPDFPTPEFIVEAAVEAARDPRNHGYTTTSGLPELRSAIVAKTKRDSGWELTPDQVLVTNGGKQAVNQTFATLLDDGDEVLLPTPYWTTYPECIRLAGGVPVPVAADDSQSYKVDVAQLDAALTERTKVLMFASPSNPTGAVYTREEIREIGAWAAEQALWVITDEIYEHLVYDGVTTGSIPVLCPELAGSTIVLNGVAKSYAMPGWRVGWLAGPSDIVRAATTLQSHSTSHVANISQRAAVTALTADLGHVQQMRQAFDQRRGVIVSMLNDVAGFRCPMPRGAFYAFPSVRDLLGREFHGRRIDTSADLAAYILDRAEVATVPGEAFGSPGYLRFSYALAEESIVDGIARLQKLFGSPR